MILCDTGPIVASAVAGDQHHRASVDLLTGVRLAERRLLLPATVAAEVGYLLDRYGGPVAEARFLRGVANGDFELVDLTAGDYARMAELVDRYDDLRLGTTDASILAVAERQNITEIATLDRRHFAAVRPRHVDSLTLLPARIRPASSAEDTTVEAQAAPVGTAWASTWSRTSTMTSTSASGKRQSGPVGAWSV